MRRLNVLLRTPPETAGLPGNGGSTGLFAMTAPQGDHIHLPLLQRLQHRR